MGDFDLAYRQNVQHQDYEILEDSPMARLLVKLAGSWAEAKPWKGTADALLTELRCTAKDTVDTDAGKDLPRSARWLSSRISELTPALATLGVVVQKLPRKSDSRGWEVFKLHPRMDAKS